MSDVDFEIWLRRQDWFITICAICETAHSRRAGCPDVVKVCSCGAKIPRALWDRMPGKRQETGGEVLELKNCPACRSTLALPLAQVAAPR